MRGDVKALEKSIKKSKRADKAGTRLERELARRRKTEPPSNVDVAAARPSDFSTEDLPDTRPRDVNSVRQALLISGFYYVTGVCEDRALLVAPKESTSSRYAAIQVARNALSKATSTHVGNNVLLLNGATRLEPQLFSSVSDAYVLEGARTVSVCRNDVGGVPLLMLTDSPNDDWPSEPADIGLTYSEFGKVQREASRLLGLRLLTEWTL